MNINCDSQSRIMKSLNWKAPEWKSLNWCLSHSQESRDQLLWRVWSQSQTSENNNLTHNCHFINNRIFWNVTDNAQLQWSRLVPRSRFLWVNWGGESKLRTWIVILKSGNKIRIQALDIDWIDFQNSKFLEMKLLLVCESGGRDIQIEL